ncbi:MAG: GntR family transcriptional regulator [Gammaproteobacteria bacterium]|nr:GntR family transcriptional regulator [Gammaproteobacteria bacterium]
MPATAPPSAPVGATDSVIQALTRAIREGHYAPGARLTEAELTRELGVSRGSLREALRRLAADGLIELAPHRGAIVKRVTLDELADTLVVRETLEGLAAALAATRIDLPGNRRRLADLRERSAMLRADMAAQALLEDNVAFHRGIIELSGNAALGRAIEHLQLPALRDRFFAQLGPPEWQRSLAEHAALLDAIADADAALAESLMRAHVRRTRRVLEHLPLDTFQA